MEPWIAAIVHRLAAYTSDAADETANVTIGSATIGSSNRNGSLKERETRTMQIYGAEITSTKTLKLDTPSTFTSGWFLNL